MIVISILFCLEKKTGFVRVLRRADECDELSVKFCLGLYALPRMSYTEISERDARVCE